MELAAHTSGLDKAAYLKFLEDEWRGLYRDSWTGVIAPEAFAHPAKYSRALIRFIYQHVIDCGWIHPGDHVVDPFGGVALGGLDAMRHGLHWTGCELEVKFVGLGNQNIALWNDRYSRMPNWGTARLIQGDSRQLVRVLAGDTYHSTTSVNSEDRPESLGFEERDPRLVISSPPYATGLANASEYVDPDKAAKDSTRDIMRAKAGASADMRYGASEGQLGAMKEGDLNLAISSPPYIDSVNAGDHGIDWTKVDPKSTGGRKRGEDSKHGQTLRAHLAYTEDPDPANLGAMVPGDFNAAISSPPFPQPYASGGGINKNGYGDGSDKVGERTYQSKGGERSESNLETMDAEGFQAAISSPPFENIEGANALRKHKDPEAVAEKRSAEYASRKLKGHQASKEAILAQLVRENDYNYGVDPENLGNQRGEDFWSVSRLILEQLFQVITPGGHAVFVVKAFVRNKQIVDFPGQWAQLCEAVGFKLIHHHRALLTETYGTQQGLNGEDTTRTIERKSFFRRLAESKGSPRIDWESVLCFEKA